MKIKNPYHRPQNLPKGTVPFGKFWGIKQKNRVVIKKEDVKINFYSSLIFNITILLLIKKAPEEPTLKTYDSFCAQQKNTNKTTLL